MTETQSRRSGALASFAVLALVLIFLLGYAPFLATRLLFAPFLGSIHIYGPIFSEISWLALYSGFLVSPKILRGLLASENQYFLILHPFV